MCYATACTSNLKPLSDVYKLNKIRLPHLLWIFICTFIFVCIVQFKYLIHRPTIYPYSACIVLVLYSTVLVNLPEQRNSAIDIYIYGGRFGTATSVIWFYAFDVASIRSIWRSSKLLIGI